MTNFSYKAVDEDGMVVSGVVEVDSIEIAGNVLSKRGYIPTKIKEVRDLSIVDTWHRVNARTGAVRLPELVLFTKQLRCLIRAGIPIVRLLGIVENQTQNRTLKRIANMMLRSVKHGVSLSDCVDQYPSVFSFVYRSIVRAGEISGNLPEVLKRLIFILEHERKVKTQIASAVRYPIFVLFTLAGAFIVLLTFVVPKFIRIFERAEIVLPLPTQIIVGLHNFFGEYWQVLIGITFALVVGLTFYLKTEDGRYTKDSILIKVPVLGPLFLKAAMSRFASIFGILHTSGVNVLEIMNILAETIGNAAISRTFDDVRDRVKMGEGIAEPLRSSKYFPGMVVDMIAVGEESGNLEEMLQDITEHYDDEVAYQVKGLEELISPILIVMLAAIVGFFALAIFMPIWKMATVINA
jgi:type IV pilus assembly protein PilC